MPHQAARQRFLHGRERLKTPALSRYGELGPWQTAVRVDGGTDSGASEGNRNTWKHDGDWDSYRRYPLSKDGRKARGWRGTLMSSFHPQRTLADMPSRRPSCPFWNDGGARLNDVHGRKADRRLPAPKKAQLPFSVCYRHSHETIRKQSFKALYTSPKIHNVPTLQTRYSLQKPLSSCRIAHWSG